MRHSFEDFIRVLRKDINPLPFDEFRKTHNLTKLWEGMKEDDIRRVYFNNDLDAFYEWFYNFLNDDEKLKVFYDVYLAYKEFRPIEKLEIKNDIVITKPNSPSTLRNINLEEILKSSSKYHPTIFDKYKAALETGKNMSSVTMPSVFSKSIKGNYKPFINTLKTIIMLPSIFSPNTYYTLLDEVYKIVGKDKVNILIPTASWCSPVIAIDKSPLKDKVKKYHIIDVQENVLKNCIDLHKPESVFDELPELKTFYIPSERMDEVIDNDYDIVFFCPPYYDLELYDGDLQSINLYPDYEEWLDKYWRKTVENSYNALNKGGIYSFVISKQINGKKTIGQDLLEVAKEKFEFIREIKIYPKSIESGRSSNRATERYESCFILKKV